MDRSRSGAEETDAWAVGMAAVADVLRHSLEQTTVRRTALTLLNLDQTRGFDCPGVPGRNGTPLGGTATSTARTAPSR